jgi:polyisoprenoid-binding protein YceI
MSIMPQPCRRWPSPLAVLALTWLLAHGPSALAEPAEFRLDPEQTSIAFFVHHLGFAEVGGLFLRAGGGFRFDEATGALSDLRVVVETGSLLTNSPRRDEHLKSADFLDVEAFPEMVFEGRSLDATGAATGQLQGELTLLGVTRPLTLEVRLNKSGRWPFGDERYVVGIDATGTLRRSEFGMTYGVDGGWVGDEIRLVIGAQAIRQD